MVDASAQAEVLNQALPYIQQFSGHTFVIKYGGNAMRDADLMRGVIRNVLLMQHVGIRAVLVHGGPELVPFDATFPFARDLGPRLRYTGYVVDPAAESGEEVAPRRGVVVSAGGGAVGDELVGQDLQGLLGLGHLSMVGQQRSNAGTEVPERSELPQPVFYREDMLDFPRRQLVVTHDDIVLHLLSR